MPTFFSRRRNETSNQTVVVPADVLIGWDEYLTRSMQREYRIIQLLKEHRRRSTHKRRAGSRASTSAASHSEAPQAEAPRAQRPQDQAPQAQGAEAQCENSTSEPAVHGGMTLSEAREVIVRERCEALRPQAAWAEVAESLGIAPKTLWDDRRKIFDSSHKFHPD